MRDELLTEAVSALERAMNGKEQRAKEEKAKDGNAQRAKGKEQTSTLLFTHTSRQACRGLHV